jgi:hypothetical protein
MTPRDPDPFYVGYDPPMPRPIAVVVIRAVAMLFALGLLALIAAALRHRPIAGGLFAFGSVTPVTGVVVERPYPALRVDGRPAAVLLVARGKHGAAPLVHGLDGRRVRVDGQRIARDGREMLEIVAIHQTTPGTTPESTPEWSPESTPEWSPESTPEWSPESAPGWTPESVGGAVALRGEVVDSKCFLGVMVPGRGKTHRACASLCLRGGIPPALLVEDRAGGSRLVLLVSPAGGPLDPAIVADRAFEPTEVRGRLSRAGGWWMLRTDPTTWRRLR